VTLCFLNTAMIASLFSSSLNSLKASPSAVRVKALSSSTSRRATQLPITSAEGNFSRDSPPPLLELIHYTARHATALPFIISIPFITKLKQQARAIMFLIARREKVFLSIILSIILSTTQDSFSKLGIERNSYELLLHVLSSEERQCQSSDAVAKAICAVGTSESFEENPHAFREMAQTFYLLSCDKSCRSRPCTSIQCHAATSLHQQRAASSRLIDSTEERRN
jgi:hypothetical protein